MPYAEGRLVHDADSHVHEPPGWLDDLLEPDVYKRQGVPIPQGLMPGDA